METLAGVAGRRGLRRVDFFTSHEALRAALRAGADAAACRAAPAGTTCRRTSRGSACAPRSSSGAHVEYFRGIRNPIGDQDRPGDDAREAAATCSTSLDPEHEPGRITLIHRIGVRDIARRLPPLVEAVQRGATAPCCGAATRCTATRETTRERHQDAALRRHPVRARAGVRHPRRARHATSAASTSSSPARTSPSASAARAASTEVDLDRDYRSQVDPRLNYEQALEMALLVGRKMGSLAAQAVRV